MALQSFSELVAQKAVAQGAIEGLRLFFILIEFKSIHGLPECVGEMVNHAFLGSVTLIQNTKTRHIIITVGSRSPLSRIRGLSARQEFVDE